MKTKDGHYTIITAPIIILILLLSNYFPGRAINTQNTTWTDEFTSPILNARWYWHNEDPAYWSLNDRPGFLRMKTKINYNRMSLLQPMPIGDFLIETYLDFLPTTNFQGAGLIVFLDNENLISVLRAYCDTSVCVGNGIYFDHVKAGIFMGSNYASTVSNPNAIWLQLAKSGNTFQARYSENGIDWTYMGQHTIDFTPDAIGLDVHNAGVGPEIPADFDYFKLIDGTIHTYLPLLAK